MADPIVQRVQFSDEVDKPTRLRIEAGYVTAALLQGQDAPLAPKFETLCPRIETYLRTGTFPPK